jgi:hypothetical protein
MYTACLSSLQRRLRTFANLPGFVLSNGSQGVQEQPVRLWYVGSRELDSAIQDRCDKPHGTGQAI